MNPAMIGALASAADTVTEPLFAHLTNVRNRKFTREMYSRSRQDALSDWNMQNEYNSPRAQMQRFQEAGLNPNLIYGQMTEAAQVRATTSSGGQASAPHMNAGRNALMAFGMQQQSAQTDLLKKQLDIAEEEVKNKQADTMLKIMNANLTQAQKDNLLFDLGMKKDLRDINLEFREWELKDLKTKQNEVQSRIMQEWEKHPHNVKKIIADVANAVKQNAKTQKEMDEIDARIKRINQEWEINKIDEEMSRDGFNPKAGTIIKVIHNILRILAGQMP